MMPSEDVSDSQEFGPRSSGNTAIDRGVGGWSELEELRLGVLLDVVSDAVVAVDQGGLIVLLNASAEQMFGFAREELVGEPVEVLVPAYARASHVLYRSCYVADPQPRRFEVSAARRDGSEFPVELTLNTLATETGFLVVGVIRDITERKRAGAALIEAQERFRCAFEDSPVGIVLLDLEFRFTAVNDAFCRIVGYTREQLLRTGFAAITHAEDVERDRAGMRAVLAGTQTSYMTEKRYVHSAGHAVSVALHATLLRSPDGAPLSFLSHAQDITDRKRHERQLEYLADHDALTELPNRRAFNRELAAQAAMAQRYDTVASVMVIDLDHFKVVNDTLGHQAGDRLIASAAQALSSRLRSTDLLSRLGGDEFGVLLSNTDAATALLVAESLRAAIREQAIEIGHTSHSLTASIGIATFQDSDGLSGGDVLVNADLAMYDAKEDGRDRAALFANAEHTEARTKARITWAHRIQEALAQDRFTLLAQPIVHLSSGAATQYELLLRMLDTHDELIPPAAFLEVAERVDLIQQVDMWVISRALRTLAELDDPAGDTAFEINLSGASIGDPKLLAHIEHELHTFQINPARVIFEITETAALRSVANARAFGERLSQIDCRFALDDFGAGFGSFYYLKHLQFDVIKIDGEFVRNCRSSRTDQLLIAAIVAIARGLGKQTIAEYVPDDQTIALLKELGVDYGQGYHLGLPAPLALQNATRNPQSKAHCSGSCPSPQSSVQT
jgi:diguanylate cyclase (GGDEF)-like protein/PAS domain S-box-containing protein